MLAPVTDPDTWLRELLASGVETSLRYGPLMRALDEAAGQEAEIEAAYGAVVDRFIEQTAEAIGADERAYELARAAESDERSLPDGHARQGPRGRRDSPSKRCSRSGVRTIWVAVALERGSDRAGPAVAPNN
jgi:hypothetical protein